MLRGHVTCTFTGSWKSLQPPLGGGRVKEPEFVASGLVDQMLASRYRKEMLQKLNFVARGKFL